jgi:hypothetical protein
VWSSYLPQHRPCTDLLAEQLQCLAIYRPSTLRRRLDNALATTLDQWAMTSSIFMFTGSNTPRAMSPLPVLSVTSIGAPDHKSRRTK